MTIPRHPMKAFTPRERRTGAIAAYSGPIHALWREAANGGLVQRVRTFAQDTPSDLQRALGLLLSVEDLAIVVHGPAGCGSGIQGASGAGASSIVTGIDERDSIMGADKKLASSILQIHADRAPAAIAIVATPVVAINNDDIESVAAELRERLKIPIFVIRTDGFRSKLGGSGHDAVVHAMMKDLLAQDKPRLGGHVNLLSVVESVEEVASLQDLLREIGIEALPFPQYAEGGGLSRALGARLSISVDPDESEYAGSAFRDLFGIPYVSAEPPIGSAATDAWLAAIGVAMGQTSEAARAAERYRVAHEHAVKRLATHAGAKVFVNLPAAKAFGVAQLVDELGLTLVGLQLASASARDVPRLARVAAQRPELPILVGEGQVFEEVNLLSRLKPDLYIARGNGAMHALRLGIQVLDLQRVPILGYAGLRSIAEAIGRRLTHPALARFLAESGDDDVDRYAAGWLAKSTHWYIKHEVK